MRRGFAAAASRDLSPVGLDPRERIRDEPRDLRAAILMEQVPALEGDALEGRDAVLPPSVEVIRRDDPVIGSAERDDGAVERKVVAGHVLRQKLDTALNDGAELIDELRVLQKGRQRVEHSEL